MVTRSYPEIPDFARLAREINWAVQLKHEHGAKGIEPILAKAQRQIAGALKQIQRLAIDKDLAEQEPNSLPKIQALRPDGPRRLWETFDRKQYLDKIEGGLLGRMAGCTLGSVVEFWEIDAMKALAEETGQDFPPTDYWAYVPNPAGLRYRMMPRNRYTRDLMDGVPVDDDIAYTLLGLLIVEDHGVDFTIENVGEAWKKYLPYACTAEDVALKNLKKGIAARKAAERHNPFCEWIGADIRSDSWGYMAPGRPAQAAEMAYRDAYISHRRQGIYGEMFFAAAIAAAFAVGHPLEAIQIGLSEIPRNCALSRAVKWALREAPKIRNYRQARDAVDRKFAGLSSVHTINNACLTIFGLGIGGMDVTRVIGETVAMGMDNDCTAATAGSIVGVVVGKRGVPGHWTKNFNNTVHSYLIGKRRFKITNLVNRFARQARAVFES